MVRVLKDALKCFYPAKSSLQSFMQRLLFILRSTAMRGGKSPSEILMGRQIRCPILSECQPMQKLLYRANARQVVQPVEMLFRNGNNTSLVAYPNGRTVVAQLIIDIFRMLFLLVIDRCIYIYFFIFCKNKIFNKLNSLSKSDF